MTRRMSIAQEQLNDVHHGSQLLKMDKTDNES